MSIRFCTFPRVKSMLEQLHFEEILLRHSKDNWCIFTSGPIQPTIVLGLSGKPSKLINLEKTFSDNISLVRRFSGGGTVIVDQSTVFITLIMNKVDVAIPPYPNTIMQWTETIYDYAIHNYLNPLTKFQLREHDYVFGDLKVGGNAQNIAKDRWLHHTSFLWDFNPQNMKYLQLPEKRPAYRGDRDHSTFLTTFTQQTPQATIPEFTQAVSQSLARHYEVVPVTGPDLEYEIMSLKTSNPVMLPMRSQTESVEDHLVAYKSSLGDSTAASAIPSLVRMGPSCVNL